MSFIHANFSVIVIAVVTCSLAWLYGGTIGSVNLKVVPWLTVLLLEVMLCFPQRRSGETSYMARERAWDAMKRDPLVWVAVGFLLLLVIPFVNNGLCPGCDAALIGEGKDPGPLVKFLPFCVDRMDHLNVFLWFLPALTVMLAVRHSLTKKGKRLLIEMIVWNGAVLAVLGFVQQVVRAPGPLWLSPGPEGAGHFFSTFGYPNMAGDYFAVLTVLALVLWLFRGEERDIRDQGKEDKPVPNHRVFWQRNYHLIPALICYYATLNTLSRAGIILATVALVAIVVHTCIVVLWKMRKVDRVKAIATGGLCLIIAVVLAGTFIPQDVSREVGTLDTKSVLDRMTGKQEYHASSAIEIWRDHPVFGCGGWGYKHFLPFTRLDKKGLPQSTWGAGSANVHNDYLQFLAEHGLAGVLCLLAGIVLLVLPLSARWRRLIDVTRFMPAKKQPIFALPGSVFAMLLAAAIPLVHAFADCPLRSPAVLTLFFVTLASAGGFLPRFRDEDVNQEENIQGKVD